MGWEKKGTVAHHSFELYVGLRRVCVSAWQRGLALSLIGARAFQWTSVDHKLFSLVPKYNSYQKVNLDLPTSSMSFQKGDSSVQYGN